VVETSIWLDAQERAAKQSAGGISFAVDDWSLKRPGPVAILPAYFVVSMIGMLSAGGWRQTSVLRWMFIGVIAAAAAVQIHRGLLSMLFNYRIRGLERLLDPEWALRFSLETIPLTMLFALGLYYLNRRSAVRSELVR
jgi:hypothetical protein